MLASYKYKPVCVAAPGLFGFFLQAQHAAFAIKLGLATMRRAGDRVSKDHYSLFLAIAVHQLRHQMPIEKVVPQHHQCGITRQEVGTDQKCMGQLFL